MAPEKSILVPTAHDEPAIRLTIFRQVFTNPYALVFNTTAEKEFTASLFSPKQTQQVAGVGVNIPQHIDKKAFKQKQGFIEDYLYYGGRIDAGKGCAELIEFYLRKRNENANLPLLVLSGHLSMDLPRDPSIVYLGFISEQEKEEVLQGALAVVIPSAMESLSLLLLEAFASSTPVLVKESSAVLKDHCVKSNGGLFYNDYEEFSGCIDYFLQHEHTRQAMGRNGLAYVQKNYSWPRVISIYEQILNMNVSYQPNAIL